ncbi:hypothetical protein ACLB2K_020367 [Fragaria x ananassa]
MRVPSPSLDQILKNEGAKSLFKGDDANILHAVAGVGMRSMTRNGSCRDGGVGSPYYNPPMMIVFKLD